MVKKVKKTEGKKPLSFRVADDVGDKLDQFFKNRDIRLSEVINVSLHQFLGKTETEQDKMIIGYQKRKKPS
ncbi:hypothetical protein BVY03_05875 [bacterium K02(2017)]|nr:hypothetical protein BVY03_05875 [bacterium K02(2017)]